MRISLNEIKIIEGHLLNKLMPAESLLFNARLANDPVLRFNVFLQRQIHIVIRLYQRKKIRAEIESAHDRLFEDPIHAAFQQTVRHYFNT